LYSFDPKTHTARLHYYFENASGDLAIAPNNSLEIREHDQLAQYIPSSQKVSFYKGESNDFDWYSFDVSKVVSLYFDRAGNLWLPAYGWLDFSNGDTPVWNKTITPPEFLVEKGAPESEYLLWATQIDMYQSSNGWYWFMGGGGIVRLDLQAAKWCLVSTVTGDVVEDVDHNLWFVIL
jgi:hypothetical protein